LHNNPLFVRSHDFLGVSMQGSQHIWQTSMLLGVGTPAGGGAYLMGSLADLPYALASSEQDFIAPENVQALIWRELVPALLDNAAIPRWWNISPNELHAVNLYQRIGEDLLNTSIKDAETRSRVIKILSDRIEPRRLALLQQGLTTGADPSAIFSRIMPADTFYLAAEFRKRYPNDVPTTGTAASQLNDLVQRFPTEVSCERISQDFGATHQVLARTYTRELLNTKPFPFFGGYSSRLFGESWESNNLYWARLADEMGYPPVMLNRLVPELTRRMTAKIFATDLEDWPAMLRAMTEAGDDLRKGKITIAPTVSTTSSLERTVSDGNAQ
jgi:hypothetical protein